jgi:hypothetical protein
MTLIEHKPSQAWTGPEKRRFQRIRVSIKVNVTVVPEHGLPDSHYAEFDGDSVPGLVTDLSPAGMHLVASLGFERHTELWISLPIGKPSDNDAEALDGGESTPIVVRGVVTRRTTHFAHGKAAFFHGIQFIRSDNAASAVAGIVDYLAGVG